MTALDVASEVGWASSALQRALHVLGYPVQVTRAQQSPVAAMVSVVIPCYNYGHYLQGCVGSVLAQPGVDVEVIIVDDCSPDGSADAAEQVAALDHRVSVIKHPTNRGHIATYNDGIAAARGEYLVVLSADDLLTPGALWRAVSLMNAHPSVGFSYGRARHFVDAVPRARDGRGYRLVWRGADWLALRCSAGYNCIASPEVVMRTSVLRRIGGYRADLPHTGDLELWMRAAAVADVGYLVGADQALYRQHAVNMHKTRFESGSADGGLIDLEHRWRAFDVVFPEPVPGDEPGTGQLRLTARRTLAREALQRANHAYARGLRSVPVAALVDFATGLDPSVMASRPGRALARRMRMGMVRLPLHPLWAPRELARRTGVRMRWGRLNWLGV